MASVISNVLRPHWLSGLANISGRTTTSFKAWLTDGRFTFDRQDQKHDSLVFTPFADETLLRAIAHDIGKLGGAAFESIYGTTGGQEIQRSTAWSLIRAYYASFYAIHALLRVFGEAVVQLEREHVRELQKAVSLSGNNLQIEEGLHLIEIDSLRSSFSIRKLRNGTHEDTWNQFGNLVDKLINLSLAPNPYIDRRSVQSVAGLLTDLLSILRTAPCKNRSNWLSYIRNQINYQLAHGAWFPHERSNQFRSQVLVNLQRWHQPLNTIDLNSSPLPTKFSMGCTAILSLTKELLEDLSNRNSLNESFLNDSAIRVLRQSSP